MTNYDDTLSVHILFGHNSTVHIICTEASGPFCSLSRAKETRGAD